MERIKALIDKLHQQKEQGFSPAQLLTTVQLLQSEILQLQQRNTSIGTAKVAVTMPVNLNFAEEVIRTSQVENGKPATIVVPKQEKQVVIEPKEPEVKIALQEPVKQPEYNLRKPVVQEVVQKEEPSRPAVTQSSFYPAFDAVEETPTLMQHQPKEVHELIAEKKESLNDRLKQQKTEVVHVLKDSPIKDLRKGIGINERFTFVSELFRGDEAMYERSIKTINGFNILSEAEYWINRELKFKLGWNDNKEEVQHFYHLVRRRFS
jgi:hypothetical protein